MNGKKIPTPNMSATERHRKARIQQLTINHVEKKIHTYLGGGMETYGSKDIDK